MSRLPTVKPLSQILPSGSEGGKEFARIIDLLLFYDARKHNGHVSLFSDRSGDTFGLDAFDIAENGYQYKFFSSPLTSAHRREITESLKKAIDYHQKSKITKWLLVTPDDLVNSGRKKGGGDVEWFKNLRERYGAAFDIEHIGHTKIQALFLQSESLCLHYYPEIAPNGLSENVNIKTIRKQYDDNLKRRYSHIEFVGMSVRKEEATRGVPMESIYIPLETVSEGTRDDDDNAIRMNPVAFTNQSKRTVILGDPGTGKSTLLRFLALSGTSTSLQDRYNISKDDRLPLLITLRRYADDLKINKNLPLIDYIVSTTQADFSIPEFSPSFVKHHLETGRAILFFDGVDELPDLKFKNLVRQRIQSLATSFPGNTVIVTSRIAGYDAEARFSGPSAFDHVQMAPLREQEIRRFAQDWHAARTDNEDDRKRYVAELMRILTDPESEPIRQLARNPLLLTIMVLVHRIDAVLPDQRVVLYQKCVETLMISWLDRKADIGGQEKSKGRTDQRQLRRIAAIAQWMHEQAGSSDRDRRAVVRKIDLSAMLIRHIIEIERWQHGEDSAADEAEDFLHFVRNKAGLLIEAGTDLYSFVHLTFQEYLTARHIIIQSEAKGDAFIWDKLGPTVYNPRWREVIRLLVAERQSEESQRFLMDQILKEGAAATNESTEATIASLAGGLLIDRVPAAMERATDILKTVLLAITKCAEDETTVSALLTQLATLAQREENESAWNIAVIEAIAENRTTPYVRASIALAALTTAMPLEQAQTFISQLAEDDPEAAALTESLLLGKGNIAPHGQAAIKRLYDKTLYYSIRRSGTNLAASIISGSLPGQNRKLIARILIWALINNAPGPFRDFIGNCLSLHVWVPGAIEKHSGAPRRSAAQIYQRNLSRFQSRLTHYTEKMSADLSQCFDEDRHEMAKWMLDQSLRLEDDIEIVTDDIPVRIFNIERSQHSISESDDITDMPTAYGRPNVRLILRFIWEILPDDRNAQDALIDAVLIPLEVRRTPIWREALRRHFIPSLKSRHTLFRPDTLSSISSKLADKLYDDDTVWGAVCWLILDVAAYLPSYLGNGAETTLAKLISIIEEVDHPILVLARELRQALLKMSDSEIGRGKVNLSKRVLRGLLIDIDSADNKTWQKKPITG